MEYMVAPGKSILTRAGQKNEYDPITAKMVGSGSIFEGLIRIGSIVPQQESASGNVNVHRVDLRRRSPASVKVKSVEVIEPDVVKAGKPKMPGEIAEAPAGEDPQTGEKEENSGKNRKKSKKNLFGAAKKSEKEEPEKTEENDEKAADENTEDPETGEKEEPEGTE